MAPHEYKTISDVLTFTIIDTWVTMAVIICAINPNHKTSTTPACIITNVIPVATIARTTSIAAVGITIAAIRALGTTVMNMATRDL